MSDRKTAITKRDVPLHIMLRNVYPHQRVDELIKASLYEGALPGDVIDLLLNGVRRLSRRLGIEHKLNLSVALREEADNLRQSTIAYWLQQQDPEARVQVRLAKPDRRARQ